MSRQSNTITLNGKLYDSVTGRVIGSMQRKSEGANPFIISPDISKPVAKESSISHSTPKHSKNHPVHHIHRATQHSQTLMRQAVEKPAHTTKSSSARGQAAAKHQVSNYKVSQSLHSSKDRAERAANVHKSNLISRFSHADDMPPTLVKKTDYVPVKAAPAVHPVKQSHHTEHTAEASHSKTGDDLFNQALSQATGHLESSKKLRLAARRINLAAAVAIVVVLSGFIFYQNMANISVKVAAQKAGIHAQVPGYRPAGFALSRTVQSYPGEIILSFHSNTDGRNFTITQASSNWDSNTLLSEYVNNTNQHYQKVDQNSGRTVYLYGAANATWVDGGIWYRIQGNSRLSSNQLLNIVNGF